MKLPESMLRIADQSSNEEAWKPTDFPAVLKMATRNHIVCLGGQFQFRGSIGTAEMYWIDADSTEKRAEEKWDEYVLRANREVLEIFEKRMKETDFDKEAENWTQIQGALKRKEIRDPKDHLVFVAYFKHEPTTVEQGSSGNVATHRVTL